MIAREPCWPGRGPLPPDDRRQRELLAARGQLAGLLEDVPAVHGVTLIAQESVFTGGAPDTSWRWVIAS